MTNRRIHKIVGLILLLPFIAWSLTAMFFLLRPAYAAAYVRLEVRQYPLEQVLHLPAQLSWTELRYLRSVLGYHLLVREGAVWRHLDPETLQERPWPDAATLRPLFEDALGANPARYGVLTEYDGRGGQTDTGVRLGFDWPTLSFTQQGRDTRWIDRIYSIHYLEWTGIRVLDKALGLSGLALLLYMTWSGASLALGRERRRGVVRTDGGEA